MNKGLQEFKCWIYISNYAFKITFIYGNKRCHILLNHYIANSMFYSMLRTSCKTLMVLHLSIIAPVVSSRNTGSLWVWFYLRYFKGSGKELFTALSHHTVTMEIYAY
jgi:hypothetical protein